MHIVTVENFLFCFKLVSAGYIIGYVGAIISFLALASTTSLVVFAILSFEHVEEFLTDQEFDDDVNMSWLLKTLLTSKIRERNHEDIKKLSKSDKYLNVLQFSLR